MPNRNRDNRTTLLEAFAIGVIICGVAVLIYATGRSVGMDVGRNEVSARQHYEETKGGALAACVGLKSATLRECVIEAVEAAQHESESRQDLYAQQDMSKWAFWMMIISGLTFLVTGLGIVWIRDTLIETRRAVSAADDAVIVTREVGENQLRPWVLFERYEWGISEDGSFNGVPHRHGWVFQLRWRNYGKTPAKDMILISTYVFLRKADDLKQHFPNNDPDDRDTSKVVLPPEDSAVAGTVILHDEQVKQLRAGTHILYMFGDAVYAGIVGGGYRTKTCISIACTGYEGGKDGRQYPRFEVSPIGGYGFII